jgi:hypothetical protein
MGSWSAWADLSPLRDLARTHAPRATAAAIQEASRLLRAGKSRSAHEALARLADGEGRHWIAVARADIAALYFTTCVRGIAWRLADDARKLPVTERRMEWSEDARVDPGDVAVEGLLTDLDAAASAGIDALSVQARIARARVTAFTSRCAPNEEVRTRAEQTLENDLATLAAEQHLTPDLAFMWGSIQMNRYSSTAARPFLLLAREGGFEDPAVEYMLALAALEQRDLARADELAISAGLRWKAAGITEQEAEIEFLRGEIARARPDLRAAEKHYVQALTAMPEHAAAIVALGEAVAKREGEGAATRVMLRRIIALMGSDPLTTDTARGVVERLEALVLVAQSPAASQAVRDALLLEIDSETDTARRGLRYFFAATLDLRLNEPDQARGHGILARDELTGAGLGEVLDVGEFLRHVDGG